MKRRTGILFILFAMLSLAACEDGPQDIEAHGPSIESGATVEKFSLPDTAGTMQTLDSLKGKNGTLVVWLSAQCPVVKQYKDRINELAAEYQAKGINFVGINSNYTEDLDWVKSNITEYGYQFPMLIDKGNVLADKWGASVTPEVYYLDPKNVLLYHGPIDNNNSGNNITNRYLKMAFDAALAGQKIETPSAKAFGCSIKRA